MILFRYLYLDNVVPQKFGVAKHPLFFLKRFLPTQASKEKQPEKESLLQINFEDMRESNEVCILVHIF